MREGQYTEIWRLCLISTGAGVGKGLQWPRGNTDPRVKKTGRKSHGPFILAGRKLTGREKRGSVEWKVSSFHSCFSSWLWCKVSADMPGAWPGLDYNIKTTTDEAEWVKAKQCVVRYRLSCFHTENNRCDNQYVLQTSGWSGFPWKVLGSGWGRLTRPLFSGECLGQEAG